MLLSAERLVLDQRFDRDTLPRGWHIETGSWTPTADGLVGSIDGDSAAVIWSERSFPDELAMVFEAAAMPGHDNDANAFFRAAGSIYGTPPNDAWIAGIAGWYVHDHGLEQHPDGPTWQVPGEALRTDRLVTVAAGYSRGRVFLWKDGRLLLERDEVTTAGKAAATADAATARPAPHDRLGLGTWDSAVRFTRLSVYDLSVRGEGAGP